MSDAAHAREGDNQLPTVARASTERDAAPPEGSSAASERDAARDLAEGITLAYIDKLEAALREITGYSCYSTPWNAYIALKRIAKEALHADA